MTDARTSPRIAPLHAPYTADAEAMLRKWMPPGVTVEPLVLFRTLVQHGELAQRMRPLGAALRQGLLAPRERELMILRTCARAGAEYEWGVHVTAFAEAVGLSRGEVHATTAAGVDRTLWQERDALVLELADELHGTAAVSDTLWSELALHWTTPQLLELLVLAGFYRLISYVVRGARLELEPWAARMPA
ncbi:MAG: carboxymuconolactone decarboxylase [Myxococcaceae bacterium]|nr:carboxymuconolactone decarboxylase [Myxococcaceae bacterium]